MLFILQKGYHDLFCCFGPFSSISFNNPFDPEVLITFVTVNRGCSACVCALTRHEGFIKTTIWRCRIQFDPIYGPKKKNIRIRMTLSSVLWKCSIPSAHHNHFGWQKPSTCFVTGSKWNRATGGATGYLTCTPHLWLFLHIRSVKW